MVDRKLIAALWEDKFFDPWLPGHPYPPKRYLKKWAEEEVKRRGLRHLYEVRHELVHDQPLAARLLMQAEFDLPRHLKAGLYRPQEIAMRRDIHKLDGLPLVLDEALHHLSIYKHRGGFSPRFKAFAEWFNPLVAHLPAEKAAPFTMYALGLPPEIWLGLCAIKLRYRLAPSVDRESRQPLLYALVVFLLVHQRQQNVEWQMRETPRRLHKLFGGLLNNAEPYPVSLPRFIMGLTSETNFVWLVAAYGSILTDLLMSPALDVISPREHGQLWQAALDRYDPAVFDMLRSDAGVAMPPDRKVYHPETCWDVKRSWFDTPAWHEDDMPRTHWLPWKDPEDRLREFVGEKAMEGRTRGARNALPPLRGEDPHMYFHYTPYDEELRGPRKLDTAAFGRASLPMLAKGWEPAPGSIGHVETALKNDDAAETSLNRIIAEQRSRFREL